MIVIYTEFVQLCCSLNKTLSQMVHLAITAGLYCSHLSIEDRYQVQNEDVVGAVPTGNAPTTSE